MEIISRAEAKAAGLTRYFTGVECGRGHAAERYTSTRACVECSATRRAYEGTPKRKAYYQSRNASPERKAYMFDIHLNRNYGMSTNDWAALYAAQGGCSSISKQPMLSGGNCHVDHDHALEVMLASLPVVPSMSSGKRFSVRGLLSSYDNSRLAEVDRGERPPSPEQACYIARHAAWLNVVLAECNAVIELVEHTRQNDRGE
jgi:hypothetical protein